jgi:hypothetical protein
MSFKQHLCSEHLMENTSNAPVTALHSKHAFLTRAMQLQCKGSSCCY